MPKLYFYHGTMNSSKTANLLMVVHNYQSQGKKVIITKPEIDTRFGGTFIKSRALQKGIEADYIITPNLEDFDLCVPTINEARCLIVDEAQFLSEKNVNGLRKLASLIPVICYGLRTDYRGKLFEGSKRLLELADSIQEIKTVCVLCDKKAIINAKYYYDASSNKNLIIKDFDSTSEFSTIDLGAEEKYQPMCWECWNDASFIM